VDEHLTNEPRRRFMQQAAGASLAAWTATALPPSAASY
jgi:hypothetical protein